MSDQHDVGAFQLSRPDGCDSTGNKPKPIVPEIDAIDKIRAQFEEKFDLNAASSSDSDADETGLKACESPIVRAAKNIPAVAKPKVPVVKRDRVLKTVDLAGLVEHWKAGGFKHIVTMVGAGISTSAGIPDFRSPTTGLYNNLRKYNLPHPTAIFDIDYFVHKPKPFFTLAKELYPGNFEPTPCHYFIRLLSDMDLLTRHYTQNIDTLDRIAGIPEHRLVEAHGTFHTNHCIDCRKELTQAWMKEQIFADAIPCCVYCKSLVKPDIVFFGENLPAKFYELPERDFGMCDLLIVMGTSLEVHPFAGLVDLVSDRCVRLLINRESVGQGPSKRTGFQFDRENNDRDVLYLGDCDEAVAWLADALGLKDELDALMQRELAILRGEVETAPAEEDTPTTPDKQLE